MQRESGHTGQNNTLNKHEGEGGEGMHQDEDGTCGDAGPGFGG